MPVHPHLFPDPDPRAKPDLMLSAMAPAGAEMQSGADKSAPVWLQRLSLFVLVLFCVYLGVLVMVLPWWPRMWDQNLFILSRPELSRVLHIGFVRGFISGLGLLDIWIGISEAIHYRESRR